MLYGPTLTAFCWLSYLAFGDFSDPLFRLVVSAGGFFAAAIIVYTIHFAEKKYGIGRPTPSRIAHVMIVMIVILATCILTNWNGKIQFPKTSWQDPESWRMVEELATFLAPFCLYIAPFLLFLGPGKSLVTFRKRAI